jgi:exonuclease SbcD
MKQPIALFLTDTHLSENNIDVVKSVFSQSIKKAKELGFDRIFHLGDIFHSRKGQIVNNLNGFTAILDEFKETGLKLVVIPGNHDRQQYDSVDSFLDPYEHHPAMELIRHCAGYPLTKEVFLSMLPFFEDDMYIERFKEMQEHGSKLVKNVLGTHIGVQGSVMNSGIKVESSITPSLFKDFDVVLIGHYHSPQELAEGRIKYIGSSLAHNFAEIGEKGIVALYDDLTIETIPLKSPKYTTFEISANDINLKDIADLKEEKETTGDFFRIVLTGSEKDIKSFNKQDLQNAGIKVEIKEDKVDRVELESRIEPFDATSLTHEFSVFCEKNKLSLEEGQKYFKRVIA